MHPLLEGLNEQQALAVTTTEGPVLILAGAGSGKTKALTHRFAYLIQEKGVSPLELLCVTFTNKAAAEMRDRVFRLLHMTTGGQSQWSSAQRLPWLGTFHAVCSRILRRELDQSMLGRTSQFAIYDDGDMLSAVKRAMQELNIDQKQTNPRAVLSQISGAKNELVDAAEYGKFAVGYFQQIVHKVYVRYEELLRQANALEDKQQMEEERRLAYVGMTRAMKRLYLLYAFERRLYGLLQSNPPSRFVSEIPEELLERI